MRVITYTLAGLLGLATAAPLEKPEPRPAFKRQANGFPSYSLVFSPYPTGSRSCPNYVYVPLEIGYRSGHGCPSWSLVAPYPTATAAPTSTVSACSPNDILVCNDNRQFALCGDPQGLQWQNVPLDMTCYNGTIKWDHPQLVTNNDCLPGDVFACRDTNRFALCDISRGINLQWQNVVPGTACVKGTLTRYPSGYANPTGIYPPTTAYASGSYFATGTVYSTAYGYASDPVIAGPSWYLSWYLSHQTATGYAYPTATGSSAQAFPTPTPVCSPGDVLVCKGYKQFALCGDPQGLQWQDVADGTMCFDGRITWARDYSEIATPGCSEFQVLVCNGPDQFSLCDSWQGAQWQDVAPGTQCVDGAISWKQNYPSNDGACTEGVVLCNGPNQFALCGDSEVQWQDVANGTVCSNGTITQTQEYWNKM